MKASIENPQYTVYAVSGSTKYNLTPALTGISRREAKSQMAQCVTLSLANIKVGDTWLSGIIKPRDRIYVYADDGTTKSEVFRGFAWRRPYFSSLRERDLQLICYDHLIYMQESETAEFFAAGRSTKDVVSKLCGNWGVKLEYTYSSITHSKLALRGTLSDIITSDILDIVKDRVGKGYCIISDKDVAKIRPVGSNSTIYKIEAGNNAVRTTTEWTMDGMVTKVVIYGKSDDKDRKPIEATVTGDTSKYGTLQKTIDRDENTTLAASKEEARNIIKKNGTPKWTYEIEAPDIPWIREGDKVYVNAGDIYKKYLIVEEVDRTATNLTKKMNLSLVDA